MPRRAVVSNDTEDMAVMARMTRQTLWEKGDVMAGPLSIDDV
jgi:hypothetical protein